MPRRKNFSPGCKVPQVTRDCTSAEKESWVPGQRTWEFGAKRCHKLNDREKGSGQDSRMFRGGIIREIFVVILNVRVQNLNLKSGNQESAQQERFFSLQPPPGSSFLSFPIVPPCSTGDRETA